MAPDILSGLFASWFVGPNQQHQQEELVELRDEIRALSELVERYGERKQGSEVRQVAAGVEKKLNN